MLSTINIEAARTALQTKYTRTVANGGILPVSWFFGSQAALNALLPKTTSVFIGYLAINIADTDATNNIDIFSIDFNVATTNRLLRTNITYITLSPKANYENSYIEFSDMIITLTGGALAFCTAIGWKFTFS